MGISDSISGMVDKAKETIGGKPDESKDAVDKVGDAADKATGGKFDKHVDKGQDLAKDQIDKMNKKK